MSDDIKRRDILRGLGGLAVTGAIGCGDELDVQLVQSAVGTCAGFPISEVQPAAVPMGTVQGYAQKSVAAGENIDFRISSPVPYDLSIVRIGWDTEGPNRDWLLTKWTGLPAAQRVVRPGSYIWVPNALAPTQAYPKLTLECWVRPFRMANVGTAWQGIISQYGTPTQCGFGLFLDTANRPAFYFGDGGAFNASWLWNPAVSPLASRQWHHLALVFDSGVAKLYINGGVGTFNDPQYVKTGLPSTVKAGGAPLRIGAYGDASGTANFLDGDIAMPAIYSTALSGPDIYVRSRRNAPPANATNAQVIGCWPLAEEAGATVADVSGCARHGTIINHGTWQIGGPSYVQPTDRFQNGLSYDPQNDSGRGHGLRLSTADLYDCNWPVSLTYPVPSDAKPGIYSGRITPSDGSPRYDITFVVRRAASRPAAPIVVLAATNTWVAYNQNIVGGQRFYDPHPGGQPTYYQGLKTPWPEADPFKTYLTADYSHLVRAERFMHTWLERNGYDYDLISDFDLSANPGVLSGYKALIIAGHSEYWTKSAWDGVNSYLTGGGRVIVASGNTMFWRVSDDGSVIECRKPGGIAGGFAATPPGEIYHQADRKRGGLMREAGLRGADAIGMESIGIGGPCCDFKVKAPGHAHFLLPETIPGIAMNSILAAGAVGHEWDVTPQRIPGGWSGSLPNATVLAQGTMDAIYWNERCEEIPANGTQRVVSEMINWTKPGGGSVFAAGAIAIGKALHTDDKLAALFRNVLHADGVVVRATAMWIGTDGRLKQRRHDGINWLAFNASLDDLGAGFGTNPPHGVQWAPNSLAAMDVVGGVFKYNYDVGYGWAGWADHAGATFAGRPAAVGWGRNRLNLLARTTGNRLYEKYWDGSTWSGWADVGGSAIVSDPSAVVFQGRRIGVAMRGTSNNIVFKERADGVWLSDVDLGETFASNPTLHCWSGDRLAVFGVKSNGHCLVKLRIGNTWDAGWTDLGGTLAGRVQIGTLTRDTFVVYGIGTDGRIKLKLFDGAGWQPTMGAWNDTLGGTFTGELASISFRGFGITLMAVDIGGNLQHNTYNGVNWGGWETLATGARPSPAIFSWISSV
jgi:hypothetical protein